jgi:hypothetical protein
MIFTIISFAALFTTNMLFGSKAHKSELPNWGRYTVMGVYVFTTLCLTNYSIRDNIRKQSVKERDGYKFVGTDLHLHEFKDVTKMAFFCGIAAVLCGMTGIAGGMVLGPLFLSYNMPPSVMSSTNQYITMIASICVSIQFYLAGALDFQFASIFGGLTLVSAFCGIHFVNKMVQKSGKQSIIAIILTLVLIFALLSLPVNYVLKAKIATPVAAAA